MASPSEVVGRLADPGLIESAALDRLQTWLPWYLAHAKSQNDFGQIAAIRSWGVVSEFDRFPEQGLPALIVMSPGTTGEPRKDGDGYYSATYSLSVAVEVAAARGNEARRIAQLYGAAVRGALLQARSLGDDLTVTDWLGDASATVGVEQRRTRVAIENVFAVELRNIVTTLGGPTTAEPPGEDEWPEITEVDLEVTHSGDDDAQ